MKACYQLEELLGKNVKRLREGQGITVMKLYRMTGITRPTVYAIEDGLVDVRISYVRRLADALGVEPYALLVPWE